MMFAMTKKQNYYNENKHIITKHTTKGGIFINNRCYN